GVSALGRRVLADPFDEREKVGRAGAAGQDDDQPAAPLRGFRVLRRADQKVAFVLVLARLQVFGPDVGDIVLGGERQGDGQGRQEGEKKGQERSVAHGSPVFSGAGRPGRMSWWKERPASVASP